jgi:hypothetical protein
MVSRPFSPVKRSASGAPAGGDPRKLRATTPIAGYDESLADQLAALTQQVQTQNETIEVLLAQVTKLANIQAHIAKELSAVHQRPTLADVPSCVRLDAPAPIPGPKDQDPRNMSQLELYKLKVEIEKVKDHKARNIVKIAEPHAVERSYVTISLPTYPPKVLWQLWHYVIEGATLAEVTTRAERDNAKPATPSSRKLTDAKESWKDYFTQS